MKKMVLPELVLLDDYDNSWQNYLEAVYSFFVEDFVKNKPTFNGTRLALKRHPVIDGKEATFWHFTTSGKIEDERIPDLRRCERIRWPKPIIESATCGEVKVWKNKRKNETRILLFFTSESYLVVLADRGNYILPWTAYIVEREHRKRKLLKEWEAYKKAEASG